MPRLREKQINILVSSNPSTSSLNLSSDGSKFEVAFANPIKIPSNAKNVTVECTNAFIWWIIANIITGQNDKFYLTVAATPYVLTIPQGLYDATGLKNAIERELTNNGISGAIIIGSDASTQKVTILIAATTTSVDFTQSDTPREIMGFNDQVVGPPTSPNTTYLADNVAAFNQVNYFLVHSTIVNEGLTTNGVGSQTVAVVPIDVQPGKQIIYKPFNPSQMDITGRGINISRLKFWLTDDQNRSVNTNGEYWGCNLLIRYLIDTVN
jgi:hypothetical protein